MQFVQDASKKALEIFHSGQHNGRFKADGSIVTDADIALNQEFIERIKKHFPEDGVIGEELSYETNSSLQWILDPIDGTEAFWLGSANWAVSLGLLNEGKSTWGLIANPVLNRLIYAKDGEGAYKTSIDNPKEATKLKVTETDNLDNAKIFGLTGKEMDFPTSGFVEELLTISEYYLDFYSVVENASYVALGKVDAAIFWWTTAHDIGPLHVIVEEAGGKVTDLFGNHQLYNQSIKGAVMSNGVIHDELIKLIAKHRV